MNGRKAKLLRAAASYKPARDRTEYEQAELQRVIGMALWEMHTRIVRTMGPISPGAPTNVREHTTGYTPDGTRVFTLAPRAGERRTVVFEEVSKIRYNADGKTPHRAIMETKTDPLTGGVTLVQACSPAPVTKPARVLKGGPRWLYKLLKQMERKVGIDATFEKFQDDIGRSLPVANLETQLDTCLEPPHVRIKTDEHIQEAPV